MNHSFFRAVRLHAFAALVTLAFQPAAHAAEHPADASPVTFPKRPAGQSTHAPAPDTLYLPAGHTAAVGLVDPNSQ